MTEEKLSTTNTLLKIYPIYIYIYIYIYKIDTMQNKY